MTLKQPIIITPRLLPGLQIGDAFISIQNHSVTNDGRTRYLFHIDSPALSYSSHELMSGVGGGGLQQGLESLLSFLGASAESYAYRLRTGRESDNEDLFPEYVNEWADQNSDELSMLQCELEENKDLIEG